MWYGNCISLLCQFLARTVDRIPVIDLGRSKQAKTHTEPTEGAGEQLALGGSDQAEVQYGPESLIFVL